MIQKIREATELLIRNLPLYSAIVLTIWFPAAILLVYLRLYVFPETANGNELQMFTQEFRVASLIEVIFGPLCAGAIIHATAQLKQNAPASYGASMAYGAQQSLRLLGARIVYGFMVGLGLLALIIPGIFLALRLALIEPIVVLERLNGLEARKRSTKLTQGIRWQILGAMLLSLLWITLISTVISMPLSLLGQFQQFAVMVISDCVAYVLYAIPFIILLLFYWEAKEAAIVDHAPTFDP